MQTASADEVAAGSNDGLDTAVALQALQLASGAIRAACGWSITLETVTGARVEPYSGVLFLPTLRLTALALSARGVPLLDGDDFTFRSNGVVSLASFQFYGSPILATYTHGYETVPDPVKDVCLEAAMQRVANPEQLASTTIDGVTSTRRPQLDLSRDPRLDPYRLVPVFV